MSEQSTEKTESVTQPTVTETVEKRTEGGTAETTTSQPADSGDTAGE